MDSTDLITRGEAEALIRAAFMAVTHAPRPVKIFGLQSSRAYAEKVCGHLGKTLTPLDERYFEDGEAYIKPTSESVGNVRGHKVFVIQSLYSDDFSVSAARLNALALEFMVGRDPKCADTVSDFVKFILDRDGETVADKFMKLCILCGALRDASAYEVNVIVPYLAWARQDRKTESRAPITTKYLAMMMESVGIRRAVFIDIHNLSAIQNAFRIPTDNLETKNLFARYCADELKRIGSKKIRVLTPDSGGLARVVRFRNSLARMLGTAYEDDIEVCIFDKVREKGKVVGGRIIGDVVDADVIAFDDMMSTCGTMDKACRTTIESGGRLFAICAAHGLFCGKANTVMDGFDTRIVVADTVAPFRLNDKNRSKVHVLDTTKMVADAVMRIHSGTGSISELLDTDRL